jgi:hypothetical protein
MAKSLVDEDGKPVRLEILHPLSDAEIAAFAERLPCPLPPEVRELLSFCSGFEGSAVDVVDFTGARCLFEYDAAFPNGLPIAADGFGNFWVVDLQPTSEGWGPLYFARHDPPVILYQSPSLEHFLVELFKLSEPPHKSLVDDVHEDLLFQVWRDNPGVRSRDECLASDDADLRGFAKELAPSFAIVDMREPRFGFGFSWGRYGPSTVVRRYGSLPLFAYQKAQGILPRLFGGPAPPVPGERRTMPLGNRLALAALAFGVALPPAMAALFLMFAFAIGGGSLPMLVWPAFLVLGSIWTYEIVSRLAPGTVRRYKLSVTAVAIWTMSGYVTGILMLIADISEAVLLIPVLGFVGALVGTTVSASEPDTAGGAEGGAMPSRSRLAVAAVALAVLLPPAAILVQSRIVSGLGGGAIPWSARAAFMVLGSIWTYEIASRIMGGRLNQHRFSVAAVSIGATGGFLAGLMIAQTLLEAPVVALVGAFLGTFVPTDEPGPRPKAGSGP